MEGLNKIFISAQTESGVGAVYLFNTNGTLLKTYSPPNPSGYEDFGRSLFVMSDGRLLFGAPGRDGSGPAEGAAYLMDQAGRVLRLIKSPAGSFSGFGQRVIAINNTAVIAAPGNGSVYHYELCGDPIKGFIGNGNFGVSLTLVGPNHLLIGSLATEGGFAALYWNADQRILSTLTESDFTSGLDGWSSAPQPAFYDATDGIAFAYELSNDAVTHFWRAPAKFLGNKSPAYNGKLRFEQKNSVLASSSATNEIILRGRGLTLVHGAASPTTNVTTYDIPLNTAGWHLNDLTGPTPSERQFLTVLSGLTALEIRAEFGNAKPETNTLDNVRILQAQSVCDPILDVRQEASNVTVTWPANAMNFSLYQSTNLQGSNWVAVPDLPNTTDELNSVTQPVTNGAAFYRLSRP